MQSLLEKYECAVCLQLIVEPVSLEHCKHVFCISCLQKIEDFSLDTFTCPMCRNKISPIPNFQIDKNLQKQIQEINPQKFDQRMCQIKKDRDTIGNRIKIIYGNTHLSDEAQQDNHHWKIFVHIETQGKDAEIFNDARDLIESVEFKLHQTFKPSEVKVTEFPFELKRIGWGTFMIPIQINFKQKFKISQLSIQHYLSFHGDGERKVIYITKLNQNNKEL